MPTIETLTERTAPVAPETPGAEVYARFQDEPDTLVIPVVDGETPVGIVERNAFFVRMAAEFGRALYARRPIRAIMDPEPVVVEGATEIGTFCDSMLAGRTSDLLRGFIVTEDGRYRGVGTVLSLLQATTQVNRRRAEQIDAQQRSLVETRVQAQASARAKAQFLAVMSHELRTPMNGVMAVAELLRRQPLTGDSRAYVDTILDSSETLLRILSDALDLARAEAGELELDPKPDHVRQLMDDVQALWAPRAAQDGVTLLISYDGDPDLGAEYDPVRLKQVFNNLIGNALRFARNGVVEASLKAVREGQAHVRLEGRVRDNGPGIPADRLESLFEPYTEQQSGASGLGLAICRQIVRSMEGDIRAESNEGRGATFVFDARLPLAHIETATESNVSELADLQLQTQPHVLIVDDNATNRVVAQALCEMFGCTSECAEDGLEAVEAVKSRGFDLVLMDIKMPRMDGVQATQAIRALNGPQSRVPIVALTANADPEDAKRYLAIGMAAVVEKPIKPERLRAAMNAALSADDADEGYDSVTAVA